MEVSVSWRAFLSESYDLLWKLFIRPPRPALGTGWHWYSLKAQDDLTEFQRSEYLISDLGPSKFRIHSRIYCREVRFPFKLRKTGVAVSLRRTST